MNLVIRLEPGSGLNLVAEWLGHGFEIAEDADGFHWLRIKATDPVQRARLSCIPARFYHESDEHRLIRQGQQVASAELRKDLHWRNLDDVLQLEVPIAAMTGRLDPDQRGLLRLVRGGEPAEPAAASVTLESLASWVELASEVRLRRLRWLARGGEALVMGDPLPPVAARYFVAHDRILIPAGWQWSPRVSSAEVRELFSLGREQWLIWESDQDWSRVDEDSLVSLRRAAVRRLAVDHRGEPAG